MIIRIFVLPTDSEGVEGPGFAVPFCAEAWTLEGYDDPEDALRDFEVRRHIMDVAVPCRASLAPLLQEGVTYEHLVGVACRAAVRAVDGVEGVLEVVYNCPQPSYDTLFRPEVAAELLASPPDALRPVAAAHSHFGLVPLFPPLQVLCAARPFFTRRLLPKLVTLDDALAAVRAEVGGKAGGSAGASVAPLHFTHYSRFPWRKGGEVGGEPVRFEAGAGGAAGGWCRTYFFYASHREAGPLHLFPLLADSTLCQADPNGSGATPSPRYVSCTLDAGTNAVLAREAAERNKLVVLSLRGEDLVKEVATNLLMDPAWTEEFCGVCAAHGFHPAPTPDVLLEVGLEKALIMVAHFFPLAPVVGYAYDHTFSTVPEPGTLCLSAAAASALLSVEADSAACQELLQFATACYKAPEEGGSGGSVQNQEKDLRSLLDGISSERLERLLAERVVGMRDESSSGKEKERESGEGGTAAFLRRTFDGEVLGYCESRGVPVPAGVF